jgi:8-oxo-dGTP pyrophosphatase MutT (NUDIX family)
MKDESLLDDLRREVREEAGLDVLKIGPPLSNLLSRRPPTYARS